MNKFGDWSIEEECFREIRRILPEGKTILEFGSGWTTDLFSESYKVYSVEHDERWIGKYNSTYIHAPLVPDPHGIVWYDVEVLKRELPGEYDLILIDGPIVWQGNKKIRQGFFRNLDLFNLKGCRLVFDDIGRPDNLENITMISKKLKRPFIIHNTPKRFGIIL